MGADQVCESKIFFEVYKVWFKNIQTVQLFFIISQNIFFAPFYCNIEHTVRYC